MKLKEKFAELMENAKENAEGGNIPGAEADEIALQKLHIDLFKKAGCEDPLEAELEEPAGRIDETTIPEKKEGWVALMNQDGDGVDLYENAVWKARFGFSCQGTYNCFGELADGRKFHTFLRDGRLFPREDELGWDEQLAA